MIEKRKTRGGEKVKIKDFTVGQTAYIIGYERHRGPAKAIVLEAEVLKVGTKYVTVKHEQQEIQFASNGCDTENYLIERTEYGAPRKLYHKKEDAEKCIEKGELKRWLRDAVDWENIHSYTLNQLRAVKRILEG